MDNKEYIKGLFDNDGVKAPYSLSEESIIKMIETVEAAGEQADVTGAPSAGEKSFEAAGAKYTNATGVKSTEEAGVKSLEAAGAEKSFKKARARRTGSALKKIVSIAAAALVVIAGIGGYNSYMNTAPDTSVQDGSLYTFSSELQVRRVINSVNGYTVFRGLDMGSSGADEMVMTEDSAMETSDSQAPPAVSNNTAAKSESHSDTYLQVDDVDEADIVKTDGKYIYYVNSSREVVILSAKDGKTEKLSTIGSSGVENYIQDIYVKGDRLITVGNYYRDDSDTSMTGIVIYDISDRSKPEYIGDFSQSGNIVSSRMVGDYVYLVTNDYVYRGGRSLPVCGPSDDLTSLAASDICCVPKPRTSSYIILSGIDTASLDKGKTVTKAVLGAGNDIYCNDHNLYAAAWEYDSKSGTSYTRIVRAALDGSKVKFNATTRVRGDVYGQFAMDESDGYLRIATTSNRSGIDVNNLYVLDRDLKEAGKVTGFARNESIKAVRFIGSKAYVITYEAINPLFIIDLSDPADPRIEGEVMIDGFSSLLVPISESRLLGIGYATGDNGYGGQYASGLKLALFDISDPSKPKVLDSREFEDMTSPAQSDHHALLVNAKDGWYAVPYEIYKYAEEPVDGDSEWAEEDVIDAEAGDSTEDIYENGVLVFKAGDSINSVDQHRLDSSYINRCVYIGEWIYALDDAGNAVSFKR